MDEKNKNFIDFIASEIGEEIFLQNKLSIHTETGNIYHKNLNTNESIYDFLQQQQGKTNKIVNATSIFNDSFSNYIREFLDDLASDTIDRFDMLANKNIKYLFYKYNDFLLWKSLPALFLRHAKLIEDKVVLEELQNRDCQYLIENLISSIKNKKKPIT